jgi:hypothetical protein
VKSTFRKLIKLSLALVAVCISMVVIDTSVIQAQLKESGSAICSESFGKPTWLSKPVSLKTHIGMALTPGLPTALFFLPTEIKTGFQTTRDFELQHSAEGFIDSDYGRFPADKCQYFRISKLSFTEDQEYINNERVISSYRGLFLFSSANRGQIALNTSEYTDWRRRQFENVRFFDIKDSSTNKSVGGITCGTSGFAIDYGTMDDFAGFRISKSGDTLNSRAWAADYLVDRYRLRAEICSFMLYTRYSAVWSLRPTYLSSSMILPTDNTISNRMIWRYDLFQLRLNKWIRSALFA